MDSFAKANDAFVDDNFEEALKLYTAAIEADGDVAAYYIKRAQTNIKLNKFQAAEDDACKACELDSSNCKAFLRKGIAQFHLQKYQDSLQSLTEGCKLDETDSNFKQWIDKCKAKIPDVNKVMKEEKSPPAENNVSAAVEPQKEENNVSATVESPKEENNVSATVEPAKEESKVSAIVEPPKEKQRYDWYQTERHVIISLMIKKCKREDVDIIYNQHLLSCTIKLPSGSDYSLELDLAHPVVPSQCSTKILSSKVECKLKKEEGIRWTKLEGEDEQTVAKSGATTDCAHPYPSSSHYTRNWDKIVKDAEKEDKEDGVDDLFQNIYSGGSDEVKKAMNKSFVESGGTVLSTNWDDIGKEKTEMKPPDGMEWKKYDT